MSSHHLKKFLFVFAIILGTAFSVSSAFAQEGKIDADNSNSKQMIDNNEPEELGKNNLNSENDPEVSISVVPYDESTRIDADWPIVSHTKTETVDATGETLVEETIVRKAPLSYFSAEEIKEIEAFCQSNRPDSSESCNFAGGSTEDTTRSGFGVSAKLVTFAYDYCHSNCSTDLHHKLYRAEVSWTRADYYYDVRDPYLRWGCALCWDCPSHNLNGFIRDVSLPVSWQSNWQSNKVIVEYGAFGIWLPANTSQTVGGNLSTDVYSYNNYRGNFWTSTNHH